MRNSESWLTRSERKRALYDDDVYFRESIKDFTEVLGLDTQKRTLAIAEVLFKPESVVGRRIDAGIDYLVEHDFVPVAFWPIELTRHMAKELWRYQFNAATLQRLCYVDLWYSACPAVLILVRDRRRDDGDLPRTLLPPHSAADRLTRLKGEANPRNHRQHEFRYRLRQPCTLLNFVHISDEPAELVRDLGVLLPSAERRALIGMIAHAVDRTADARNLATELYSRHAEHDLNFSSSLTRIRNSLKETFTSTHCVSELLDSMEIAHSRGLYYAWEPLVQLVAESSDTINRWDLITVAAHLTQPCIPGVAPLLMSPLLDPEYRSDADN